MLRLILIATSLLAAQVACAAAPDDYEIRFFRPSKIGDRCRVQASGSQESHMELFVKDVKEESRDEKFEVSFDAVAEVIKTDENGQPTEISYRVNRCVRVEDGKTQEIVPKDAVLFAQRVNDETKFSLKEGSLDSSAQASLSLILSLGRGKAKRDDEVFGTKERKRIGDVWPVNAAAAVQSLKEDDNVQLPESAVKGEVKVLNIRTVNGLPCLELTATFSVRGAVPGMGELPPSMKLKRAEASAEAVGLFPIDITKAPQEETYKMTMEVEVVSPDQPLRMVRSGTRMRKTSITPVEPEAPQSPSIR